MSVDEFIEYELQSQLKLYKKYGGVQMVVPNKEQLISAVTFSPYIPNSTFGNYLDSFESNYFNMWDSSVRTGYLTGMTTQQIVKRVMGYPAIDGKVAGIGEINTLRNSIKANTRTALQMYANNTREYMLNQNAELFSGYKWVATLDRRTCIVCGSMESHHYKTLGEIHEKPPVHLNCRCLILPIIDGLEDIQEEDTRASEFGQVDEKITFDKWLEKQSDEVQLDVLGRTRYEMFQNGTKLTEFVSDNKIIPLKMLN